MKKNKEIILTILFSVIYFPIFSITYTGNGSYYMVERTNFRRYDNKKYTGLVSREVRSFVGEDEVPANALKKYQNDTWYSGSFYIIEQTVKSQLPTAAQIDGEVESVFHISSDGNLVVEKDNGYPTFRSFPAFPKGEISIGSMWRAEAVRAVDPLNKGIVTRLPIYVEYTLTGEEIYHGEDVWRIKAVWATRYGKTTWDFGGDKDLKSATGSHKADILVIKDTGTPIFITDMVDETFVYADGHSVQFKGTLTMFTEFPPAVDYEKIIPALQRIASIKISPENTVDGTESNVSMLNSNRKNRSVSDLNEQNIDVTGTNEEDEITSSTSVKNESVPDEKVINVNTVADTDTTKNNIVVEKTSAGLRLSVQNIRFVADSSEIISSEKGRLDEIASVLRLAKGSSFLVEGHTASVGKVEGEKKLSVERAKCIVDELVSRGISADRFIYTGFGGEKPVASNSTDEGRAKNRRVEITILE